MDSINQLRTRHRPPPWIQSFCIFCISISCCWIAERTSLFEKIEKTTDARFFLLSIGILVLASLRSWTSIPTPARAEPVNDHYCMLSLPREQTEEWKGWMQMVILLYHYFGLSKNLAVYQVVRVLVAAYMFLTGYSHTSYFLKTNDFSLDRTTQILLRLNLLSCVLSYVFDKSCDFYYFPLLTSFWYVVIFATLRCARTSSGNFCMLRVSISLLISCVILHALLYTEAGQLVLVQSIKLLRSMGGPHINPKEFIFRLKLDSIVPFWGASLAVMGARSSIISPNNVQRNCLVSRLAKTHLPWLAAAVVVQYFLAIQQFKQKLISNAWHPFISIIPIICMLILRNATSGQRRGFNRTFRWIGVMSLETYILQSHLWLTNNNKGILHIQIMSQINNKLSAPVSWWLNGFDKFAISMMFLLLSHVTANAMKQVIEWLTSGSKKKILTILMSCWLLNLHWMVLAL